MLVLVILSVSVNQSVSFPLSSPLLFQELRYVRQAIGVTVPLLFQELHYVRQAIAVTVPLLFQELHYVRQAIAVTVTDLWSLVSVRIVV